MSVENDNADASVGSAVLLGGIGAAALTCVLFSAPPKVPKPALTVVNPVAMRVLAEARLLGRKRKWSEAAARLRESAIPDNPSVLLAYARILARGWGIPSSPERARDKLLIAVQQEFPKRAEAAFELAKLYRQSSEPDCFRIAFEWFHKSAEWGLGKAHAELGRHYARGIGTPVNFKKALKHYRIAAESGSASALLRFATTLSRRQEKIGVFEIDPRTVVLEGLPHLRREAHAGKVSAAKALGRLYSSNKFIPAELAKAHYWFRVAVRGGDTAAMRDLGMLILKNKPNRRQTSEGLGHVRKAAGHGDPGALTGLARLHLRQKFGLDPREAPALLKKAVDAGHGGAMEDLARLYFTGTHVAKDIDLAKRLAIRGASLGHRGSKALLLKINSDEVSKLSGHRSSQYARYFENEDASVTSSKEGR